MASSSKHIITTIDYCCKIALKKQPKWQTIITLTPRMAGEETQFANFRPRIWTSVRNQSSSFLSVITITVLQDKEELLGILPEMNGPKCVNGISWLLYENPMIIMDDTYFFQARKVDDLTLDLTTYGSSIFRLVDCTYFIF